MEIVDSEISNASAVTLDAHIAPSEAEIVEAPKVDIKANVSSVIRNVHIPYILNGELYEIQSQDGENVTVKCCHCPPDRVYRGSVRSTGNFHMHIKRRHPDLLGKLHDMKVNALLERRERFLKNRRVPAARNRHSSGTNDGRIVKREIESLSVSPSLQQQPVLSLMHTHKLKIKRAFQRHQQLQQQQQRQQQHWNVPPFVATPVHELASAPINYSLKERSGDEEQQDKQFATLQHGADIQVDYLLRQTKPAEQLSTCERFKICSLNCQHSKHSMTPCSNNEPVPVYAATTAANTPSPSMLSSYGSQTSLSGVTGFRYNNIVPVKNEEVLTLERAVDLSMQASGGSLSSGIGSMADALTCGGTGRGNSAPTLAAFTNNSSNNTNASGIVNTKWSELLSQVENSLRDLKHEMRMRNQIETNRIFLDIAKFKYLHPGFNFHY